MIALSQLLHCRSYHGLLIWSFLGGMNMSFSTKLLSCLVCISHRQCSEVHIVRDDTAQFHITLRVYQLYNVVNYTLWNLCFSEIARQAAQIKLLRKLQKQEQARVAKEAKKQQGRRLTCIERWDLGIPSLPSNPEFLWWQTCFGFS